MPTISRFYGIVVAMYFADHPPPHVHVRAGGHKARIAIVTGEMLDGDLPPRALRLVRAWCALRRVELEVNWERARARLSLMPVGPLQ